MQPHSMVAVYAADRIWNHEEELSYCEVRIRYDSHNKTETKYYHCYISKDGNDRATAKVRRQGGDGLSCEVNIKKVGENKFEMTHATQHISGLREEFTFAYNKKEVNNGKHYNSLRYGDFDGYIGHDEESLTLKCSLKTSDGKSFIRVPYELKATSRKYEPPKNKKDESTKFGKSYTKSF